MSRPRFAVLPGGRPDGVLVPGRGHVNNLHNLHPTHPVLQPVDEYVPATRVLFFTDYELDLTLAALEGHTAQSVRDVGAGLREQSKRWRDHHDSDPTPAGGIPRPERGA